MQTTLTTSRHLRTSISSSRTQARTSRAHSLQMHWKWRWWIIVVLSGLIKGEGNQSSDSHNPVSSSCSAWKHTLPLEEVISLLSDYLSASTHLLSSSHTLLVTHKHFEQTQMLAHKLTWHPVHTSLSHTHKHTRMHTHSSLSHTHTHTHTHTRFHTSSPTAAVVFRRVCVIDFCVCVSAANTAVYFPFSLAMCLQLSARKPPAYGAATAGY